MPTNVFDNSFLPEPNDRRVIFACGKFLVTLFLKTFLANPWLCDNRLEW
jgi:hypothetical protein